MPKKRHYEGGVSARKGYTDHVREARVRPSGYEDRGSMELGPAGHESRSKNEYHRAQMRMKEDSHMIKEDYSAPALCPRGIIDREWGSNYDYILDGQIMDLYGAVSATMKEDSEDLRKELKPTNW